MSNRWFPPEWHEQSAVMLTWPHEHSDWASILQQVEPVFVEISFYASLYEKVLIAAYDQQHQDHICALLEYKGVDLTNVNLYIQKSNDTWSRDFGPITVFENERPLLLDFVFNGWGNKFTADLDNDINRSLLTQGAFRELQMHSIDFVLEGGSIETDGKGTLLTTSRCLLSETRNPTHTYQEIETLLQTQLGVERFLWLDHGALAGDDTDSHIDTLARFCDPDTIAYCYCDDESDDHFNQLQQMEQQLKTFRTAQGNPYRLIRLPLPAPKFDDEKQRLPATYANFLIINGAVLVPTYNDPADNKALRILKSCFPDREIIGIDCLPLIQQYGSLHCITMQLPVGVIVDDISPAPNLQEKS